MSVNYGAYQNTVQYHRCGLIRTPSCLILTLAGRSDRRKELWTITPNVPTDSTQQEDSTEGEGAETSDQIIRNTGIGGNKELQVIA